MAVVLAGLALSGVPGTTVSQPPLPGDDGARHLGAATCGNSTCHAAQQTLQFSNVLQYEYIIWRDHDRHSKAFDVLKSDSATRMATNLGLGRASEAPQCLRCHADFVPPEQRGKNFNLVDGVSCEACHGGSEKWLGAHSSGVSTRKQNIAAGMYPTDDPSARARLCLSCHFGSIAQPMTHELHAAGHERLKFELDAYSSERPAHHRIDQDYRQRKPQGYGTHAWVVGQLATAGLHLELIRRHTHGSSPLFPELSHFECYSCHRMFGNGAPGSGDAPRTRDGALQMLTVIAAVLTPDRLKGLEDGIADLHTGARKGETAWLEAAAALSQRVTELQVALADVHPDADSTRALLDELLKRAVDGVDVSPIHAEQAALAAGTLVFVLEDLGAAPANADAVDKALDNLYATAGRPAQFDLHAWRASVKAMAAALAAGDT